MSVSRGIPAITVGAQNAASYQLATEEPVIALGGFNGSDPAPTLEQFKEWVAQGKVHYFIGGGSFGQQNGGASDACEIATWVQENFTAQTVGSTTTRYPSRLFSVASYVNGATTTATSSGVGLPLTMRSRGCFGAATSWARSAERSGLTSGLTAGCSRACAAAGSRACCAAHAEHA